MSWSKKRINHLEGLLYKGMHEQTQNNRRSPDGKKAKEE
jgi:hypothetical protein